LLFEYRKNVVVVIIVVVIVVVVIVVIIVVVIVVVVVDVNVVVDRSCVRYGVYRYALDRIKRKM
jgi:hypothetical protein